MIRDEDHSAAKRGQTLELRASRFGSAAVRNAALDLPGSQVASGRQSVSEDPGGMGKMDDLDLVQAWSEFTCVDDPTGSGGR